MPIVAGVAAVFNCTTSEAPLPPLVLTTPAGLPARLSTSPARQVSSATVMRPPPNVTTPGRSMSKAVAPLSSATAGLPSVNVALTVPASTGASLRGSTLVASVTGSDQVPVGPTLPVRFTPVAAACTLSASLSESAPGVPL